MKFRFGIKMVAVAFLIIFISSMAGYIAGARSMRAKKEDQKITFEYTNENVVPWKNITENKNMPPADAKSNVTEGYILRENSGSVSLYVRYKDGREELYQNCDIPIESLPRSDRETLREGIFVVTLSEALSLMEDYS